MFFHAMTARLLAVFHLLLGHKVTWRGNKDEVCGGDISCRNCHLIFWCRMFDPKWMGGGRE